jgi:hypothetical protein
MLSSLLLQNGLRDFIDTSQECLSPSLVVHIVRNFCLDYFWPSYEHFVIFN